MNEKANAAWWAAVTRDPGATGDLWQRVTYWRERLTEANNYPVLEGLESSWRILDDEYEGVIKRADESRVDREVLPAFFYHVDMGFYPPPEYLLALHDAFRVYMASEGEISLEEAFFGPPRKRGGVYASRAAARFKRIHWGFELYTLMRREKCSKARAAEILADRLGPGHDPETVARRAIMPPRLTRGRKRTNN